jgi:predicted RecA/RadA family phage recombinase
MKNTIIVLSILAVLACMIPADAANNYIQKGDVIDLTWSSASPLAGAPVVKGTATASGIIFGVALKGTATVNETVPVGVAGVFDIPVQALGSAIAIGDYIYAAAPTNINTCTASCTNTNTGYVVGKSLEALVTASNTQTIKVLLINR